MEKKENADLVVHATITRIVPTNATVAGLDGDPLGGSFVIPVLVPRLPHGSEGRYARHAARRGHGRRGQEH
jgi:hypothetical protein